MDGVKETYSSEEAILWAVMLHSQKLSPVVGRLLGHT